MRLTNEETVERFGRLFDYNTSVGFPTFTIDADEETREFEYYRRACYRAQQGFELALNSILTGFVGVDDGTPPLYKVKLIQTISSIVTEAVEVAHKALLEADWSSTGSTGVQDSVHDEVYEFLHAYLRTKMEGINE